TAFGTANPRRGSPTGSSRSYHQSVRKRVEAERPWRYTASKSRERERRFRRCTGLDQHRVRSTPLRPTGACVPWRGGASGSAARRASTCAHEIRACASACVRSAGRCASWREAGEAPARGEYSRTDSEIGCPQPVHDGKAVERGCAEPPSTHAFHTCGESCG